MRTFWILLSGVAWLMPAGAQSSSEMDQDSDVSEGTLIFAYICFAVGGILIIAGFARLIWWAWIVKKSTHNRRNKANSNPNFYTYYKDPWLRAPSMASLASISQHNKPDTTDIDDDSLRVDTDAIYAQPADADPHGIYLFSTPPTEQELSQTESQIYADASNGNGSNRGDASNIYSVPHKFNTRGVPVTSIDEEDDVIELAPALPTRTYQNGDVVSLTEADRSSMRELAYVEPPADYSPARHQSKSSLASSGGFSITSGTRDHAAQARLSSRESGSRPSELSGEDLFHTAVFRDSSGAEVNRFRVAAPTGSVKSMKSLYKYMESDEPCALDNEIDYNFISSIH